MVLTVKFSKTNCYRSVCLVIIMSKQNYTILLTAVPKQHDISNAIENNPKIQNINTQITLIKLKLQQTRDLVQLHRKLKKE